MREHIINRRLATLIGTGSLFLWAIEAVIVSELARIPVFEVSAILFAASFFVTAVRLYFSGRWSIVWDSVSWFSIAAGVFFICGSDLAYILAFKYAPPAHVDLIDFCWPFVVIIFASFLPNEKLNLKHAIGAILGLAGIFCLIISEHSDGNFFVFNNNFLIGYAIAFIGMLIWGTYSIYSSQRRELPTEMPGIYCLFGSAICVVFHVLFEQTVVPNMLETSLALLLGCSGAGIAYQLWDHGVKFGNMQLMSVLSYTTPPISMALLVFFGKAELCTELYLACGLITVGVIVASVEWGDLFGFYSADKVSDFAN